MHHDRRSHSVAGSGHAHTLSRGLSPHAPERRFDVCGEQVEVESLRVVGIERGEAESLPPGLPRTLIAVTTTAQRAADAFSATSMPVIDRLA
jgi:hypothetical protein